MLYSGTSGCIRAKVYLFGQGCCIRGKSRFIRTKFVFEQSGCIWEKVVSNRANRLYSGKMVVFGENGCNRVKVIVFGQSGCIWVKVIVIGQYGFIRPKIVCNRTKWL